MNPEAQDYLNRIIKKEFEALTPGDVVFLRARKSYLTDAQIETFKKVFEGKVEKKEEIVLSLKDLKVRGEAVGLKYKVGTKKEDYLKQIEELEK